MLKTSHFQVMKNIPAYPLRLFLLMLLLPLACKEKEQIPATGNGPVNIRYHQMLLECTESTSGNKGVAILDFRFDTYADEQMTGHGSGKYLAFNSHDYSAIEAAIQSANSAIAAGSAEVKSFPTLTDFIAARLARVPGHAATKDLSADAIWGILASEETTIARLHGTGNPFDPGKFLADLLATPARAQVAIHTDGSRDYHTSYYYNPAPQAGGPLPEYKMNAPSSSAPMPSNARPEQRNARGETASQQAAREEAARAAAQAARTNRGPRSISDIFNGIFERLGAASGLTASGGSAGDPHIRMHDGLGYGFQTIGEFIATQGEGLEIQARQEDAYKANMGTVNTAVAARLGSDEICFLVNPAQLTAPVLFVNKKQTALAALAQLALSGGNQLRLAGDYKLVFTNAGQEGVTISWNTPYLNYTVMLGNSRKGHVTGLMGNYDGDYSNDFRLPDGTAVEPLFANIHGKFADAWRISNANSLFVYDTGKNTASYTDRNFPKTFPAIAPEKLAWAEDVCKGAGVTRQPELGHCMFDVGLTGDTRLAQSAVVSQQDFPASPEVATFTGLKIDLKEGQTNDPQTRNLLDLDNGTLYPLARGAEVARDIDVVFDYYSGPWFAGGRAVKNCGVSCGAYHIWPVIEAQRWPYFQNTFLRYTAIPANQWGTFSSAADLRKAWTFDQGADEKTELTHPLTDLTNGTPLSQYLWSFMTQQGKRGLIRFTQATASKGTASFVFDIKIER